MRAALTTDGNPEDPRWLRDILQGTGLVTRSVQAVLGIGAILASVQSNWAANPWQLGLSGGVVALVVAWLGLGFYLRRRRPGAVVLPTEARTASSYLRGLLPFEKNDQLLGRDNDAQRLLGLVRALEFRCGFVSGEAGAGKTSLLRAKLVTGLESEGWRPIYLARTGSDPGTAIRKAILAALPDQGGLAEQASTAELLQRMTKAFPGQTILIIIDQFEEYFVTQRMAAASQTLEDVLKAIAEAGENVRLLFALRKEFVDDLLDLGKFIPELENNRWRLPVRNFSPETAREVLRKITKDEQLRFSDELQDLVVADLTSDGRVRPVEFQIVLTRLLDQGIFDVTAYRSVNGAQGVIARFLGDVINPPDMNVDELERRIAKLVLRMLCNEGFTTRRPTGLTQAEILDRVLAQLKTDAQISVSRPECERAVERVLRRLLADFVVILDDEKLFYLAHDYLASPIRDATAEIETVEERANRLLEQYVEQSRADRLVVVPYRTLRTINRFASPERQARSEASALIRRSRWYARGQAGIAAAAVLLLLGLALPYGTQFPIEETLKVTGRTFLSPDGRLLANMDGSKLRILQLDRQRLEPQEFAQPVQDAVLGPHGDSLLALGTDGALYRGIAANGFQPEKLLDDLGWRDLRFWQYGWGAFSPDGQWLFASSSKGELFAWPANNKPQLLFRLSTLADDFGDTVPPPIGMTPDNRFLWTMDGNDDLFVLRPGSAGEAVIPLTRLEGRDRGKGVVVSPNSKWLVLEETGKIVRAVELDVAGTSPPTLRPLINFGADEESSSNSTVSISPNSEWVIARQSFNNFHATRFDSPAVEKSFPALSLERTGSDSGATAIFDESGQFVAGRAQDKLFHVWALAKPPGTSAKPIYSEELSGFSSDRRQSAFFCTQPGGALISGGDGTIHHVPIAAEIGPPRQIGRLSPGELRFAPATDDQTVFVFSANQLAYGACGSAPRVALEHASDITGLSNDKQGNLIVMGARDVVRLGRYFYLFGMPVWQMPWPAVRHEASP